MTATPQITVTQFSCRVGHPDSTSYVCVDTAKLLLNTLPQSAGITAWLADTYTDEKREQDLNMATKVLEPLNWKGTICSCEQSLQWPRNASDDNCQVATCSEIPADIQLATAYLAAETAFTGQIGSIGGGGGTGGNANQGGGGGGGDVSGLEPFDEVEVGPIRVKMRQDAEFVSGSVWGWDLLSPFLQSILAKWIEGGGSINGDLSQGNVTRGSVAKVSNRLPYQIPGKYSLRGGRIYPRYPGNGFIN